jgi:formylglycine-generating enzyme required for sulfatase activity
VIWRKNGGGKTHPVDRTYNNHRSPFGAVDMLGNVWEWVADWYDDDYYKDAPERNPKGPFSGSRRVLRGGSWNEEHSSDFHLGADSRFSLQPWMIFQVLGFRCAKAP